MNPIQTKIVKFDQTGGPEVLKLVDETILPPNSNEVMIRHKAIGVNYLDTYYRSGLYATALPSSLGSEGAGLVEAIGKDVTRFKVGDRVAYATGMIGSYSELRNISENNIVKIPDDLSFELVASSLLKGLTVQYLFTQTYKISKDEVFLFHAAAGGVGLLACQFATHAGAKLIGTVSSPAKAEIAQKNGAWKTINYRNEDVAAKVLEFTDGKKVSVVYDSVGKDTWEISLNCLRSRGMMVSFGNASGAVTGVNLGILAQKGSLYVTRPVLNAYVSTPQELQLAAVSLFNLMSAKILVPETPKVFKLSQVVEAHTFLESRERAGSLVLIP